MSKGARRQTKQTNRLTIRKMYIDLYYLICLSIALGIIVGGLLWSTILLSVILYKEKRMEDKKNEQNASKRKQCAKEQSC